MKVGREWLSGSRETANHGDVVRETTLNNVFFGGRLRRTGGMYNCIDTSGAMSAGQTSVIGGGYRNTISTYNAAILGGSNNTLSGPCSAILGGVNNNDNGL